MSIYFSIHSCSLAVTTFFDLLIKKKNKKKKKKKNKKKNEFQSLGISNWCSGIK